MDYENHVLLSITRFRCFVQDKQHKHNGYICNHRLCVNACQREINVSGKGVNMGEYDDD